MGLDTQTSPGNSVTKLAMLQLGCAVCQLETQTRSAILESETLSLELLRSCDSDLSFACLQV